MMLQLTRDTLPSSEIARVILFYVYTALYACACLKKTL